MMNVKNRYEARRSLKVKKQASISDIFSDEQ